MTAKKGGSRIRHLLRYEVVAGVLVCVLLVEVFGVLQSFRLQNSATQIGVVLPAVIVDITNAQRTSNDLGTLTPNATLATAAQAAADDMATEGYFAHVSPNGTTPWDWLAQAGYSYQYAGENLAVNFDDSRQLVDAWMSSPTHRANILGQHFTEIGVGMATGTYQGHIAVFVVQFFGSPLLATPSTSAKHASPVGHNSVTTSTQHTAAQDLAVATPQPILPALPAVAAAETEVATSPHTYATDVLVAIGTVFALLLVAGVVPTLRRLLHPHALINGAALVVVIIGLLVLNEQVLFANVTLPADTQSASVVMQQSQ